MIYSICINKTKEDDWCMHPQDGYDIGDELSNISVIFEEYEEVEPILEEESFDA